MKKVLFVMLGLCGLLTMPAAKAQTLHTEHPNEISASYGVSLIGTTIVSALNVENLIGDLTDGEYVAVRSGGSPGIFNIGYINHINRVFGFGANAGFNRIGVGLEDKNGKITNLSANIFFVMADAKANWFRRPAFGMYSKVGLGLMRIGVNTIEPRSLWLPTGQLSLIGMEIGRQLCGFLEFGAGMQGIVQLGAKYHF